MINFCSSVLKPEITSNTISTDGYEVTNLIAKDSSIKYRNGFLAYCTVKPPISITINFLCSVNLSHVILWPQIGKQKSTRFEIHVKADGINNAYKKITDGHISNFENGIIFYRNDFHSDCLKYTSHINGFVRKMFFNNTNSFLKTVKSLEVKIIKTESSIPALAKIEVWGYPSDICNNLEKQNVLKLWNNKNKESESLFIFNNVSCEINSSPDSYEFEIPEEFLDPITCIIMTLPIILPCGKVVDQTTLDKYKDAEANWGRTFNDPFTGIMFTEKSRPIPAVSLKARIDKFLFQHSERKELWCTPRISGRKTNNFNQSLVSSENKLFLTDIPNDTCSAFNSVKLMTPSTSKVTQENCKRSSSECDLQQSKKICGINELHTVSVCKEVNTGNCKIPCTISEDADLNLNSIIQTTLAHLPKYTTFNKNSFQVLCCDACKSEENIFKLPCSHFLCRKCLVSKKQLNNLRCNKCKSSFQLHEPIRYHT